MSILPERDEGINFWPVYSDLAMVMVLILLLFVLIQFVVNSKTLIHEAESLANANEAQEHITSLETQREAERRRVLQLTIAAEEAKQYARELEERLTTSEVHKMALQLEVTRQGEVITRLREQDVKTIKTKEELDKRQQTIATAFKGERGVEGIRTDGNLQTFTFSADVLFPSDQANLSPQGEELLQRFSRVLQQHPEYYTRIEVEGHADENRSSTFFRRGDVDEDHGNWRLSAERAITVAQLFQTRGISGQRLGVVGRSFYDPVTNEHSPEAMKQNRRVQVRLFYSEVAR